MFISLMALRDGNLQVIIQELLYSVHLCRSMLPPLCRVYQSTFSSLCGKSPIRGALPSPPFLRPVSHLTDKVTLLKLVLLT